MASPSHQFSPRSDPNQQRARHAQAFLLFVRYAILDIIRRSGSSCDSARPRSDQVRSIPETHPHSRPLSTSLPRSALSFGGRMWTQLSREVAPSCVKELGLVRWAQLGTIETVHPVQLENGLTQHGGRFSRSLRTAASRRNSRVFTAGTGRSTKSRNGATSCRGWWGRRDRD
jgi:hypothetical protein